LKLSVSLSVHLPEPLTYRAPDDAGIGLGSRVLVPLGRRAVAGWVTGLDSSYAGRLKDVLAIIDDPFVPGADLLEFARLAAAAYFTSAGVILDHGLPPSQKSARNLRVPGEAGARRATAPGLAELERLAAGGLPRLRFRVPAAAPAAQPAPGGAAGDPWRWLLAPDREEEYRRACERTLAAGRSVILVVPDPSSARYWQERLAGVDPYQARLGARDRERIWSDYRRGKPGVVCGGLAALCLPLPAPGLVIVDRASAPAYARVQGSPFRLDHLAALRARGAGVPLLNGALSHTCASWQRRQEPGCDDRRGAERPAVQVHPLRGGDRGIPPALLDLARRNVQEGRRTLVLVNRVQPALYLFCEPCGRVAGCPRCGAALQADGDGRVSCRRCAFRDDAPSGCRRCGRALEPLHDVSLGSLERALERVCGEGTTLALTAAELGDPPAVAAAARQRALVIATPAALTPYFRGLFAVAAWIKPESFVAMEEFDAAERIHAGGAEIAAALQPGGELHVFSVFHFHYALRLLGDEERFFERELKYRRWFQLPPLADVYELELRAGSLRELGAALRALYGRHRDGLGIRRVYLASRRIQRGSYRGVLELHAAAGAVAAAGLHRLRRASLRRIAG
jgi:primosomal protein N' (replication factor Y)